MSPRGVAIPGVELRLFDAAERVLEREGPAGLTSRAITAEAGTANGLLFRHFGDLDTFLGAFVHDRFARVVEPARLLVDRAGLRTIEQNLLEASLSIAPTAAMVINLVLSKPSLAARLGESGHEHRLGLRDLEQAFAAYLEAERDRGRVQARADTGALALALVASVHQLALTYPPGDARLAPEVSRVVAALVAGIATPLTG